MSRMLDALKQIEARRSGAQAVEFRAIAENSSAAGTIAQTRGTQVETDASDAAPDMWGTNPGGLHPAIQAELDRLIAPPILIEEATAGLLDTVDSACDSARIEEALCQAETAMAAALEAEGTDAYEDMGQYILTQIKPGRAASLLFTSPRGCPGQTHMLRRLSEALIGLSPRRAAVLDASPYEGKVRGNTVSDAFGAWQESLEGLKRQHQLVLVDGPALTDRSTAAMVSQCDGVYLVIRLGYATAYDVDESTRVIRQCGGRLLGCVAVGDEPSD
jgi:hypothetical protein